MKIGKKIIIGSLSLLVLLMAEGALPAAASISDDLDSAAAVIGVSFSEGLTLVQKASELEQVLGLEAEDLSLNERVERIQREIGLTPGSDEQGTHDAADSAEDKMGTIEGFASAVNEITSDVISAAENAKDNPAEGDMESGGDSDNTLDGTDAGDKMQEASTEEDYSELLQYIDSLAEGLLTYDAAFTAILPIAGENVDSLFIKVQEILTAEEQAFLW